MKNQVLALFLTLLSPLWVLPMIVLVPFIMLYSAILCWLETE